MIYIEADPIPCVPNARWRWNTVTHLFCDSPDSLEDLHTFARRIGLKRSWFQAYQRIPHYDLSPGKRQLALHEGVAPLSPMGLVQVLNGWNAIRMHHTENFLSQQTSAARNHEKTASFGLRYGGKGSC